MLFSPAGGGYVGAAESILSTFGFSTANISESSSDSVRVRERNISCKNKIIWVEQNYQRWYITFTIRKPLRATAD